MRNRGTRSLSKPSSAPQFLTRCATVVAVSAFAFYASAQTPAQQTLSAGWQLQDVAKVPEAGAKVSALKFAPKSWYKATVPGTVLTTLVNNGVYPEPLYGENNRPDRIPESLNKTSYWYRTIVTIPAEYKGKHTWLNFDGINFAAEVWVNGTQVGTMRGAFKRGIFDISSVTRPGEKAAIAVLITPQPHPGVPSEHTIANGMVTNGGITAIDGPTFLSTISWDWIPGIRDRDSGIWAKVFLSATGPVLVKDPLVTTDLPLPKTDSADIAISTTLENITDQPQSGSFKAEFGEITLEKSVQLAAHESKIIKLDPATDPSLHILNPKLWWPNGYGPQNLYDVHLSFQQGSEVSDSLSFKDGVRKIQYSVPDSPNLTISVNGVRVFIRGGDWGLDEALKRIPRQRLEAEIKMHAMANMNLIRNWVGQSTGEDFYELCDKYGILLWDEFFQPNPSDGPNPDDLPTYMANVRDKILRYRNHPAIAVWCARNEGFPPKAIDDQLRVLMAELEPTRRYQPSSTSGAGVNSGGPYWWRSPRDYYVFSEAFKTEIGTSSIPTIESLQGMLDRKDWEQIDDAWAEHDLAHGASHGDTYPATLAARYGKIANMADFVRKSQLANYEAYRAMYEGRNAKLFNPSTAVITWMSNPAQPSFVWQLYHHDLEPNSGLFAVQKSSEMIHIQLNELTGDLEVINNTPELLKDAKAHIAVYNLAGELKVEKDLDVAGAPSSAIDLGAVDPLDNDWQWPTELSQQVHFFNLSLKDSTGKLISENFYWRGGNNTKSPSEKPLPATKPVDPDNLQAMDQMKPVALKVNATQEAIGDNIKLTVTLTNPGPGVAVMAHLQLRHGKPPETPEQQTAEQAVAARVLPVFYSDNYISLVPKETRTITIEAAKADLKGEPAMLVLDGWNIALESNPDTTGSQVPVILNTNAQVAHWNVTGLPIVAHTWK